MAYFPAFINLDNKKILIVGGGYIAHEKLVHLLEFTQSISLISKEYSSEIKELISKRSLSHIQRGYQVDDIKGFDIVIAAVDDFDLQEAIYNESRNYSCLCNCVDLPKCCDFIFPSYIKKGDLIVAISTSGSSPAMAKNLRIWLENIIPDSIGNFLNHMKAYRKAMPKGKERMKFLDKKAKEYIENIKEEK